MEKLIFYPMGKRIESSEYTVPAGVKNIGEGAFTGAVLKKINLPEGVTSIGGSAFYASGITEMKLPSSLKAIESFAFCSTPLAGIELPAGVSLGISTVASCSPRLNFPRASPRFLSLPFITAMRSQK